MSHCPRTRPLLLAAAVSALALMPPAHADGIRVTYMADQTWGGAVFAAPGALGPVLGPMAPEGRVTFRPSVRLFQLTIDDLTVPDGLSVPVIVSQTTGKVRRSYRYCVPVGLPYRIAVPANVSTGLRIIGASWRDWQPCSAPATAGTAEITWG